MTPAPEPATKDRILDAAERLFAFQGFDGTSLRAITNEAGVNLAAVNYHFQSKEALLCAIYARRAGPINKRRLELLDRYEESATAYAVEPILEAFLVPIFEVLPCVGHVPLLMVRMQYLESGEAWTRAFYENFQPVVMRFGAALRKALPNLPAEEFQLRVKFMIGAMMHALALAGGHISTPFGESQNVAPEVMKRRLIRFVAAGLRAPAEGESL